MTTTAAGTASPVATPLDRAVTVDAPARLHLGFLDPAGTLGRRFGSLGLVVQGLSTRIVLRAAAQDRVSADHPDAAADLDRAAAHLRQLQARSGCEQPLHLHLVHTLAPHSGLGSGTQLALAIGRGFARWHGLALSSAELAAWLGRGRRSGIGIAGFDQGGLLLDGGPMADGRPAPLLARLGLPPAWRVLVVSDPSRSGLSGPAEQQALARLAPLGRAQAAEICHETLMRVLPGAAGDDFASCAAGISRIQQVLGEHFAPAQHGEPYTSPAVGRLMRWLAHAARNVDGDTPAGAGIGQSSWGPTGFALLPSAERAQALLQAARAAGVVEDRLRLRIVAVRDQGATVIDTRSDR
ncbi:beta-RFAP synthase [Sphaerotilus hippei]|uniref:Beta-RFAP synthase n=1 Tax=Sphaerotilus hippei TaxID=744406 RepID=A0A318GYG5_9BURK|nr:beta-ribofuranosylaminobenzene 5'-phosphate synthase family protein [Sphaerotilus hippei]PXW91960.1 beta-RFAP synthase [Sphaerotilus hippei]